MKPRPTDSLRRKLLTPLIWLWLFSSILATLVAFWFAGRATDSSFDRILKDDALAVPKSMTACVKLDPKEAKTLYSILYKLLGKQQQ